MTNIPKKIVVDCATGETTEIPLTPEEIAQAEADAAAYAEEQAQREAAEAARTAAKDSAKAKLAALGLSDEEVSALLG